MHIISKKTKKENTSTDKFIYLSPILHIYLVIVIIQM